MTKSLAKDRMDYMDSLKGILMILVVMGHMVELWADYEPALAVLHNFIYAFHMPVFMFVSGYFSKNINKGVFELFNDILVPVLPFELFSWILHVALRLDNTYPFLTPIITYWYVFALFLSRVVLKIAVRIRWIVPISFIIALYVGYNAYVGKFFELSRFFCNFPFFLLGYYCTKAQLEKMRSAKPVLIVGVAMAAAALTAGTCIYSVDATMRNFALCHPYENNIDVLIRGAQFLISMLMIPVLVKCMPRKKTFLSNIGRDSLRIYMLHLYPVELLGMVLPHGIPYGWGANLVLTVLLTAITVALICSLPCKIVFDKIVAIMRKVIYAP